MRILAFHQTAFDDYSDWAKIDKKLFERIRRIISECAKFVPKVVEYTDG